MKNQRSRRPARRPWIPLAIGGLALAACHSSSPATSGIGADRRLPFELASEGWRTDPVWYDGQAEIATYRATQSIYGQVREYTARAYTNVQRQARDTTTKSAGDGGVEVFKHHWSERIPTERYDYDFSTATFLERGDLAPFKFTFASQEDCGASFKQWQPAAGGWQAYASTYFPGGGERRGEYEGGVPLSVDMLSAALRAYPFDAPSTEPLRLTLVPSQRSTRATELDAATFELRYLGTANLDLPIGALAVHELELENLDDAADVHRFAFAADGSAPWLHVLAAYFGPGERSYLLESLERDAYWER
jgi:hypothetical protein